MNKLATKLNLNKSHKIDPKDPIYKVHGTDDRIQDILDKKELKAQRKKDAKTVNSNVPANEAIVHVKGAEKLAILPPLMAINDENKDQAIVMAASALATPVLSISSEKPQSKVARIGRKVPFRKNSDSSTSTKTSKVADNFTKWDKQKNFWDMANASVRASSSGQVLGNPFAGQKDAKSIKSKDNSSIRSKDNASIRSSTSGQVLGNPFAQQRNAAVRSSTNGQVLGNPFTQQKNLQTRIAARMEIPEDDDEDDKDDDGEQPADEDQSMAGDTFVDANESFAAGDHVEEVSDNRTSGLKPTKISEIDWSKFEDDQHVQEFLANLTRRSALGPPSPLSPADSVMDPLQEDIPLIGKGKGRAVEAVREVKSARRRTLSVHESAAAAQQLSAAKPQDVDAIAPSSRLLASDLLDAPANTEEPDPSASELDALLAKDLALQDEIKKTVEKMNQLQTEWADRIKAINLEKQLLLERQIQEEADRTEAALLQKQYDQEREEEELECQRAEEEAAALRARLLDCMICGDGKDKDEFPGVEPTLSCQHPIQTCLECMHSWLASQFETKGVSDLKCPICPAVLSYDDVLRGASEATFAAYEKMLTRNALSSLPEFSWCLAPECDNGQLNLENENFMECSECQYKQCLKHKVPWHTGETCEQYDYRTSGAKARDEEAATEAMLDEVSKKCPGPDCGWRIQKRDGCDHMTCKRCKFEFCWECLASHKEIKSVGNTAHKSWCKFHSDNLEVSWPFNVH